ncbi:unnamed protein product [marine sediment metagenome]|uniref:Uncharacterized protein n=1 Tax=marine sediment metagenome TaxID=412755 RepID=X1T1C1_9ZZZZ
MKVAVNCPIAGCGILVQVQNLPRHIEKVHELDGEVVLKLHPTSAYQHTPADDQEQEEEITEEERKQQYEAEAAAILKAEEQEQEPEPEKEPEPGEEQPGTPQ